ncbi:hypothetical protein NQ318_009539 [Aromia moschata]|uniref:DNA-directed RNA polymerase n=1 Tax=Aromia moschata TaxID=1265417 RepID=A0AAV8Y7Z9_9CUCU|nr:hypothetical protein NQ318_009539 [Aromia moschata]
MYMRTLAPSDFFTQIASLPMAEICIVYQYVYSSCHVNQQIIATARGVVENATPLGYTLDEVVPEVATGRNPHRWVCTFSRNDNNYESGCAFLVAVKKDFKRFCPQGSEVRIVMLRNLPNRPRISVEFLTWNEGNNNVHCKFCSEDIATKNFLRHLIRKHKHEEEVYEYLKVVAFTGFDCKIEDTYSATFSVVISRCPGLEEQEFSLCFLTGVCTFPLLITLRSFSISFSSSSSMNKDNGPIPTSPLFALINKDNYGSENSGNEFNINRATMPRKCSVNGCRSNYKGEEEGHVTTYSLPQNEAYRRDWIRKIPTDVTHLKAPQVCIKHFMESDIIRTDVCYVKGERKEYPRKIPKLKEGALPMSEDGVHQIVGSIIISENMDYFIQINKETVPVTKIPKELYSLNSVTVLQKIVDYVECGVKDSSVHNELKLRKVCEELTKIGDSEVDRNVFFTFIVEQITLCQQTENNRRYSGTTLMIAASPLTDKSPPCGTCNKTMINCPGHFGYIDLPLPLVNPLFHRIIGTIMRIICIKHCITIQIKLLNAGLVTKAMEVESKIAELIAEYNSYENVPEGAVLPIMEFEKEANQALEEIKGKTVLCQNTEALRNQILSQLLKDFSPKKMCMFCKSSIDKIQVLKNRIIVNTRVTDYSSRSTSVMASRVSAFESKYMNPQESRENMRKIWNVEKDFLMQVHLCLGGHQN